MKPEWLVKINMEIAIKLSKIRNLASIYLCLFMKIQRFGKATLKCDIVGKEHNYKYLVALYTHHFRERFTFSVHFSLPSLFLGNLRREAKVFIHTRLLRVNTITWQSKKNQLCVMLLKL